MSIIKSGTTNTTAYSVDANTNGDLVFIVSESLTAMSITAAGAVSLPTSSLTITSGATLNGGVVVNEPGADVDFRIEGDGNSNLLFVDASADQIYVGANSGTANGRLQINADTTNSYPGIVSISKGDQSSQQGQQLVLMDSDNTNLRTNFIVEDTGTRGGIGIQATEFGTSNDRDIYLAYAGGIVTIGGRNPDTGGGALQLQGTTYGGITFPASQVASSNANTLDDYEEGTWTPVIGGVGGESGQSYSGTSGSYTKIGNVVIANFRAQLTAKGTITGNAQIKGLPFTVSSVRAFGAGITYFESLAVNWNYIFLQAEANSTAATLYGTKTAVANSVALTTTDLGNSSQFNGSLIYLV